MVSDVWGALMVLRGGVVLFLEVLVLANLFWRIF